MKREFLEGLGIEKEVIDKIMDENGKDIENLKKEKETLESEKSVLTAEKDNLETKLNTANDKIQEFSKLDIEQIKTEAADYKTKFEESQATYEAEMNTLKLNHSIDMSLANAKVKNVKAVKALLNMESIQNTNDLSKTLEEQLNGLKKSDSYLFDDGKTTTALGGGGNIDPPKKDMTYSEMMAYIEANPGAQI